MIKRYTEEEFKKTKNKEKLKVGCEYCNGDFLAYKDAIVGAINKTRRTDIKYCSRECYVKGRFANIKRLKVKCHQCGAEFEELESKIIHDKVLGYKNKFCSMSCGTIHRNKHKTWGGGRSKLEKYVEKKLLELYPNIKFLFNDRLTVGLELDIYIPELKLAFEFNGPLHYEAFHGQDVLNDIRNRDSRKFQNCIENKISLCIIDVSKFSYFKIEKAEEFLRMVTKIIDDKLS